MAITYTRTEWQNDEAGGTPISAENLNNIEDGISSAVDALNNIEELLSPLSIDMGGTGATSQEEALANIGAAATQHKHAATDINSGTLAVARGGTGGATAEAARVALAVASTSELAEVSKAVDEVKDQIQAVQDSVSRKIAATNVITASEGVTITGSTIRQWGEIYLLVFSFRLSSAVAINAIKQLGTVIEGYRPWEVVGVATSHWSGALSTNGVISMRKIGVAADTTTLYTIPILYLRAD